MAAVVFAVAGCVPYASVAERRPRFLPKPAGIGVLAAAETRISETLRNDREKPFDAISEYLAAAQAASSQLQRDPANQAARRDYNFALARVFSTLRESKFRAWGAPLKVHGTHGDWTLVGRAIATREPILSKVDFIPADQVELNGSYVKPRYTKDGVGAPLIARVPDATTIFPDDPFIDNGDIYYGVTAVARFEGRRCVVTFEDPLQDETVDFMGHRMPLAADFTAPLAMALARENPQMTSLERLFFPEKFASTARLLQLQPYDPKKIPVLCVHGLKDTPATWTPMLNRLRGDPEIRKRCQFWFYSYPSGFPYPYSAAVLRNELDAFDKLCPKHRKVVLVGHSMGGIISRLMITDTGNALWLKLFTKPPQQARMSPTARRILTQSLIFKHRLDVGRVIFIAAPHRGSDLASNWIGRIASSFVRAPATLVHVGQEVKDIALFEEGDLKLKHIPNSIDTLAPNNRFVKAINTLPITRGIPYHTIVGDRGRGDTPKSSDGVVPYWSSHLDGAASELVVPADHGAHQNAQAIAEVRRILLLDARSGE